MNREYMRDYKQRALAGPKPPDVDEPKDAKPKLGPVTAGVTAVVRKYPSTARPDLFAQALSLAGVMDDPMSPAGSRVTASRELRAVMAEIGSLMELGGTREQPKPEPDLEEREPALSPVAQLRSRRGA